MNTTNNTVTINEKKIKGILNLAMLIFIVIFSFNYLDVGILQIITSIPNLINFITVNFMPPNFSNISMFVDAAFDTILFAIVGTYISALLSFFFGILMADSLTPNPIVGYAVRFFISFLRNIPVLIWVSLMVFVFGIGNMVGLIGLVLATVGFLSRSYAESINEIAGSKLEAMRASGANLFQLIFHGLIPEFAPAWLNWTLFSFEINIRASAILGIVGAGGMGILIQTNLNLRNFPQASALIIILIGMVLATEFLVNLLRRKVNG